MKRQSSNREINGSQKPANNAPRLSGVNNDEFQESVLLSASGGQVGAMFYEQEYKRIRFCHKKVSRLIYGSNGLISYMCNLFAFFTSEEMNQALNFYFALKE